MQTRRLICWHLGEKMSSYMGKLRHDGSWDLLVPSSLPSCREMVAPAFSIFPKGL